MITMHEGAYEDAVREQEDKELHDSGSCRGLGYCWVCDEEQESKEEEE